MALYLCPETECGEKVSSKAKSCPKCGCKVKKIFKGKEKNESDTHLVFAREIKDLCLRCGSYEKIEFEQLFVDLFKMSKSIYCYNCEELYFEETEEGLRAVEKEADDKNKLYEEDMVDVEIIEDNMKYTLNTPIPRYILDKLLNMGQV